MGGHAPQRRSGLTIPLSEEKKNDVSGESPLCLFAPNNFVRNSSLAALSAIRHDAERRPISESPGSSAILGRRIKVAQG